MRSGNYIIPYTRWCCCLSNRNGSFIIALFGLLLSIIITIFSIIGLVFGAINNEEPNMSNYSSMEARVGSITSLTFGIINVILNVMLFLGIYRHQHKCMVPWLVMFLLFIIISLPVAIFSTIGSFNSTLHPIRMSTESLSRTLASENRHVNFYPVLFWLIVTPLEIYLWIVVFSLYRDIYPDEEIFDESPNNLSSEPVDI